MASPFDTVGINSIIVTKPALGAERDQAVGRAWAPMAIVGVFADPQQRRWGVAIPLKAGLDETSVRVQPHANTPGKTNGMSTAMIPNPREYTFVPLFENSNVPFQTRAGQGGPTAEMGKLADPFAHSDLRAQAAKAFQEGVEPKRLGMATITAKTTTIAPPTPRTPIIATTTPTPLVETASASPRLMERAERYGAAKAAAVMDALPTPSPAHMHQIAAAYGVLRTEATTRQSQVY